MEARLAKIRTKEKAQREKYLRGEPLLKRRKTEDKNEARGEEEVEQFVLEDYDSDREGEGPIDKGDARNGLSAETLALMEKLGMNLGPPKEKEDELEDEIKVHGNSNFARVELMDIDLLLL
jgi:chromosome transmission fidelity protein 1